MANLQVKNISDALHKKIQRVAKAQNQTLGDFVVKAIEKELEQAAFRARLSERPATTMSTSASALLDEARRERDEE